MTIIYLRKQAQGSVMNVVEIQDTSVENMFVTMSSIGNVYVNTVFFNCDISFRIFC